MLALPGVVERLSHGAPCWFLKRQIAAFVKDHHGKIGCEVWCAAPPGAQEMLIASNPDFYFRPPYWGPSGWIGMKVDNPDWDEVAGVLAEAHDYIKSKK